MNDVSNTLKKSLLVQASKYIADLKTLDQVKNRKEVMTLLEKFPYLSNLFFAMGMLECVKASRGINDVPARAGEEILKNAEADLESLLREGKTIENLSSIEFYFGQEEKSWAVCLYACGYLAEERILSDQLGGPKEMIDDKMYLKVFKTRYALLHNKSKETHEGLSESDIIELTKQKNDAQGWIKLVEWDVRKAPKIMYEKLAIIEYILGKNCK